MLQKNNLMGRCLKITIHEVEEHSEEVPIEADEPLQSLQKYLLVSIASLGCFVRVSVIFRMVATMYTIMGKI